MLGTSSDAGSHDYPPLPSPPWVLSPVGNSDTIIIGSGIIIILSRNIIAVIIHVIVYIRTCRIISPSCSIGIPIAWWLCSPPPSVSFCMRSSAFIPIIVWRRCVCVQVVSTALTAVGIPGLWSVGKHLL